MKSNETVKFGALVFITCALLSGEDRGASAFRNKVLDVNARNTDLIEVLSLIAMKAGLRLDLGPGV